jgi:hypothetical protein
MKVNLLVSLLDKQPIRYHYTFLHMFFHSQVKLLFAS